MSTGSNPVSPIMGDIPTRQEVPMKFNRDHWSLEISAARWLIKLANDRVHAGAVRHGSDAFITLRADGAQSDSRFPSDQVQWIRPLMTICMDGWTVLMGFHPDETVFETWWTKDEVTRRIMYADSFGFAANDHVICGFGALDSPAAVTRARAHVAVHDALQHHRLAVAAPTAHQL